MEEDIKNTLNRKVVKNILAEERLNKAVEEAVDIINFEAAHNIELIQALEIVKQYIVKKKLVCYGGTAMNALLPKKDKFYDVNYELPDYDFYTYDSKTTVTELVDALKKAGFKNIYERMGIHAGTKKILVNYVAIADITEINMDNYKVLYNNSKIVDGVCYANENILRMMMYLELSRPRGEVERWKKVYERLQLLNKYFPIKDCKSIKPNSIPNNIQDILYSFIIQNQRVVANIELHAIYKKSLKYKQVVFNTSIDNGTIIFYSNDMKHDTQILKSLIPEIQLIYYTEKGDFLSNRISIRYNNKPIALLIEETACHSYNTMKTNTGETINVASLETLITLHYSLYFFSKTEKVNLCTIGKTIKLHTALASSTVSMFSAFPTLCYGYQKGFPTLLAEKLARANKTKKNKTKKKNEY